MIIKIIMITVKLPPFIPPSRAATPFLFPPSRPRRPAGSLIGSPS